MKKLIWFNAFTDQYEAGTPEEYSRLINETASQESFSVLYELSELSSKLADKLVAELNLSHHRLNQAV